MYFNVQLTKGQLETLSSLAELTEDRASLTFANWAEVNAERMRALSGALEVLRAASMNTAPPFTVWPSAAGPRPVLDMTSAHIRNVIRLLERRIKEYEECSLDAFAFEASCRGEMASYYASHGSQDAAARAASYAGNARCWITEFERELRRRGEHF